MINALLRTLSIAAIAAVSGCASQPLTTVKEPMALDTALKRARFQMNCPEATGAVLSKQTIEPAIRAPRYGGAERAEFTIGVSGCGKRETLVVICSDEGDGCFAADGERR